MKNFIQNVIDLRKEHGLSKKEMASIMHISVSSLSKIEKGEIPRRTMLEVVFYMSDYFDISCDKLIGKE